MAQYDLITGLDIAQAALLDAGEASSISGRYGDDAKRAVRNAYWSVLAHARWPWAMSPTPGVISTVAAVNVVVSSIVTTTVTLSATIATSMAGRKFYLDGNQSVYRISAHTAGTNTMTLDASYVETLTTGSGVIFQDEYAIPATALRVWDPLWPRGWQWDPITIIDKPLFEQRYGRGAWGFGSGIVEHACEVHPQAYTTGAKGVTRQLRFAPWSEDALNIEYDYTMFHDLDFSGSSIDGDTPRIPREHRAVLVHFAAAALLLGKDDAKSQSYAQLGAGKLLEMKDQYISTPNGALWVGPRFSASLGCT